MQNNNCQNDPNLTTQRVAELDNIANEIRKHRLEWNSYSADPSTVLSELTAEASELKEIFESLQGLNFVSDSFYVTFNDAFTSFIAGNPDHKAIYYSPIEVFQRLSSLFRQVSLQSDLINRQCDYYTNLHNETEQLEISNMEARNTIKSA